MSTYSTRLKIELIGSGEQSNAWGNTTNNNFSQSIEQSIAGVYTKNLGSSSSPVTLTTNDGPQTQANNEARQATGNEKSVQQTIEDIIFGEKVEIL